MDKGDMRILMGNEAIGRGIVESGCSLAASYPGTPASEILEAVVAHARETGSKIHAEWSVNEKVAYEIALANSYTGRRSAVSMKQVGLNVASDPFMRSAYLGVKGGMVVIVADDPGPHSSQTEQDSRLFALFAKVPVLDPSCPAEARDMVNTALELSERHEIPVMLRPTTRVCHSRQNVACHPPEEISRKAFFERDPGRWCATPAFIGELHRLLNVKMEKIAGDESFAPRKNAGDGTFRDRCIISSGVAFAHTWDMLEDMGLLGKVDFYQVTMPYPLNTDFINNIKSNYQHIAIIEETYPVIELQLAAPGVSGRRTGAVPNQGELTPEVIRGVLEKFLEVEPGEPVRKPESGATRPTLCAGCGHRAAFYAISKAFPRGIITSDIGCYTLGINLGAVDTCHCMGAGISQAAGFYHSFSSGGDDYPAITATIGDSTFFHAGIPALLNAVFHKNRFILVILDNSTTAMTGHQPTPQVGITAQGKEGKKIFMADLVRACGVEFSEEIDPYDIEGMVSILKEADRYCRSENGNVAVIIAKHPCILDKAERARQAAFDMSVTGECTGCRICIERFECPALVFDEDEGKVAIDAVRCINCGVCVSVCPVGAIRADERNGS